MSNGQVLNDKNEYNNDKSSKCYRVVNKKRNSLLISLVKYRRNKNRSFIGKLLEIPIKQRRKSDQEDVIGQKMNRLNCLYPESIFLQHVIQKAQQIENKSTLRKAVKRASMIMSTVKYWKNHSQKKIEVGPIIKFINTKESCLMMEILQHLEVLKNVNYLQMRKNEGLINYTHHRTSDKTKSLSHHLSNIQTQSIKPFYSRYSIQNVHIRIKQ